MSETDTWPVRDQDYITTNEHATGERVSELRDDYTSCKVITEKNRYTEYVHRRDRHVVSNTIERKHPQKLLKRLQGRFE